MTDLLEKHKSEMRFNIALRHIDTGLYLTHDGLTTKFSRAHFLDCDYRGMTVEQVFADIAVHEDWLQNKNPEEFEIESRLA